MGEDVSFVFALNYTCLILRPASVDISIALFSTEPGSFPPSLQNLHTSLANLFKRNNWCYGNREHIRWRRWWWELFGWIKPLLEIIDRANLRIPHSSYVISQPWNPQALAKFHLAFGAVMKLFFLSPMSYHLAILWAAACSHTILPNRVRRVKRKYLNVPDI